METGNAPPPQYTPQPGYPVPPAQAAYPPPQGYPQPPPPVQGYPPQQGYAPPPQGQHGMQNTTVVMAPPIVAAVCFRETPVQMNCTTCHSSIVTATAYETGTLAWLIAGILCLFAIWPCCLIPFCVDGCKDVVHSCPSCHTTLGVYRRM